MLIKNTSWIWLHLGLPKIFFENDFMWKWRPVAPVIILKTSTQPEKVTVAQSVKIFPTLYDTGSFIIVFTTTCHWNILCALRIQSPPLHDISLLSVLIILPFKHGLSSDLFPSGLRAVPSTPWALPYRLRSQRNNLTGFNRIWPVLLFNCLTFITRVGWRACGLFPTRGFPQSFQR
jgi:hypothetical protein